MGKNKAYPELPDWLGDIEYQSQQLNAPNDHGHQDRKNSQYNRVIQNGNLILCQIRRGVQRHHERAVNGIEQAHASREEDRENQDEPDARALGALDGRDPQQRNFGRSVEPQAEHDAQRIHLPRPVDQLEQFFEHMK